jgi:hypothetical protein
MKSILMFFQNKKIMFLFILLVLILISGLTFSLVEGFDLGSFDTSSLDTLSKPIPEQYQYLAPLPEGSIWAPDFQDKFVEYLKKNDPKATKENLSTPSPIYGGKTLMQMASQKEAQYYMDNGLWPYDEYVVNYFTKEANPPVSATQLEQTRKMFPNRAIYKMISFSTVPQLKMLNEIGNINGENKTDNGKSWKCTKDGELQLKEDGGSFASSTDYSFFPNNISGFSYEGDPCNVCQISKLAWSKGGLIDYNAAYNSLENTCKFKMSGEVPEAYNVYIGKYGNAPSESIPSSTTSTSSGDEYQKCISSCDKYK